MGVLTFQSVCARRGHHDSRLKLDRLGVAFGDSGNSDARRAANDRFGFDEMNNARRRMHRQQRGQRFYGSRAHRACSA